MLATITFFVLDIGETTLNIDYNVTCCFECVTPPTGLVKKCPNRENGYFSNSFEKILATVDISPDALNLRSKGKFVTAYVELPEDFGASDIDVSTVELNGEIPAELRPTEVGDYDDDGVLDLMVKFDRQEVIALLSVDDATLTITGEVNGTHFEGSDTIRVIGE